MIGRITALSTGGVFLLVLAGDLAYAEGAEVSRPPIAWCFLTLGLLGAAACAIAVRRVRGVWVRLVFGACLLVCMAGALAGSLGPVGGALSSLAWEPYWLARTARGRLAAWEAYRGGSRDVLGFSMSELYLAGADDESRMCRVIYIDAPTDAQRERLLDEQGLYPSRPRCIGPGVDAVACGNPDGRRIGVFPARILVAGCILEPEGIGYNYQMVNLLLPNSIDARECGFSLASDVFPSRTDVGSYSTMP